MPQHPHNRISEEISDHPFTDYWDIFILKHQHPLNIALHIIAILWLFGLSFAALVLGKPWLLLYLPLSQLIGLTGHLLFERTYIDLQDAIFSWRASRCLGLMLFRILSGKYRGDIRQRREILSNYHGQPQR